MCKWLKVILGTLQSSVCSHRGLALENLALRQQLATLKYRWHRQGFRYYWRWKSRKRGRPRIDGEIRQLIRRMCSANPLWGAPRIHGELLKLGIEVSEATVSKYMIRHRGPPSQHWRTFLQNHSKELISLDFLTVPTASFKILFVLVILSNDRRRILHFNVTDHPTAAWTMSSCLVPDT